MSLYDWKYHQYVNIRFINVLERFGINTDTLLDFDSLVETAEYFKKTIHIFHKSESVKRNADMWFKLCFEDITYVTIARQYEICPTRARQIFCKFTRLFFREPYARRWCRLFDISGKEGIKGYLL